MNDSARGAGSINPPIRRVEFDLGEAWPPIPASMEGGPYGGIQLLVRLHGSPIGLVLVALPEAGIEPADLQALIEPEIAEGASAHLLEHGCAEDPTRCRRAREQIESDGPPLSVVIPTRNRPSSLARSIDSLFATGYHDLRVIVADNAPSGPETERLVRERPDWAGRVIYVHEDRAGVSLARNRGVSAAGTELVAFVDDDVVVDRGWATALVADFLREPKAGCICGPIVAAELAAQPQLWIEEYGGYSKGFVRQVYDCAQPPPSAPLFPYAAGRFGSGANMAFRRSVLQDIGGFDEALGAGTLARGGEDLAAFFSALQQGRQLVYQPGMLVNHYHHRDFGTLRRVVFGYGMGLSAYLTKAAYDRPARLVEMARRVRPGLAYLLDGASDKNRSRSSSYPSELMAREFLGVTLGPFAYLAGRVALRRRAGGSLRSRTGARLGR